SMTRHMDWDAEMSLAMEKKPLVVLLDSSLLLDCAGESSTLNVHVDVACTSRIYTLTVYAEVICPR
ncbi:MAG: hypothetical protein LC808_41460, partial [Actinobacteria bacterium]|nr:hypothetical protein [Actinomycetota bacterium]